MAYYIDGLFAGWYADSTGSVSATPPKLYGYSESQMEVIRKNFSNKMRRINKETFAEAVAEVADGDILSALSCLTHSSESLLRGKQVELRIIECPYYSGVNPDFDKAAYEQARDARHAKMKEDGVFDIPAPSIERSEAVARYPSVPLNKWIDADYKLVREWASVEPTQWLGVILPDVVE